MILTKTGNESLEKIRVPEWLETPFDVMGTLLTKARKEFVMETRGSL